jgi:hypothetical protein
MNLIKKTNLLFSALAMAVLISTPNNASAVAGDIGTGRTLNTSPLWADNAQSYHACNAVNVTVSNIAVTISLLSQAGVVLKTAPFTILPGQSVELANPTTYSGFARCRFSNVNENFIRANISVFHWTGTYYDTLAIDSAR